MKRKGSYFNALGNSARSAATTFDPEKLPDPVRAAWVGRRDAYRTLRASVAELAKERATLEANADLTADAKARKLAEIEKRIHGNLEEAARKADAEFTALRAMATQRMRTSQGRDPLPAPKDSAEARLDLLLQAMHRDQVDHLLDRVLEDRSGAKIDSAYAHLAEAGDPALLHMFESWGRDRVQREGSEAQRAVLDLAIENAVEERVDDGTAQLLDQIDALEAARLMFDGASSSFVSGADPALMLTNAEAFFGKALTGGDG
jgi:hypothetical protein